MPEQAEFVDGDDYSFAHSRRPAQHFDTRTADANMQAQIVELKTAVAVLTDEVRHLREDVGRLAAGESQL